MYALNRLSQILVYDENGNWQGYYQLPYSFGGYSMYTYDDYVCFSDMTVPGNIYQYDHKGFAYGEVGDMPELSFDDISDAEHIVEMINQQREKYLQKYPEGAVYEKN